MKVDDNDVDISITNELIKPLKQCILKQDVETYQKMIVNGSLSLNTTLI